MILFKIHGPFYNLITLKGLWAGAHYPVRIVFPFSRWVRGQSRPFYFHIDKMIKLIILSSTETAGEVTNATLWQ